MYEDKTLICKECGNEFVFTAGEQEFYAEKGFVPAESVSGLRLPVIPAVELLKFPLSRVRTDLFIAASASQRNSRKKHKLTYIYA